ncbi:methyltransferase domain-containing protein [Pseudomonas sp. BF-R-24]|uniref:methyltransferase domain-containing protein n=1 Tax=Pseudomonas sp. BF-R-24 TaxID=2832386 RepID=UPI001CBC8C7E|nr:methyltransferase domain-containing protein [Pseudomonas sp. BF-R-24]
MHNRKTSKDEYSEQCRKEADKYFKNNKFEEAVRLYNLSIEANSNNATALNNLAVLFEELGNDKEAERLYKQACASPKISSSDKLKFMQNLAGIQEKNGTLNATLWTYQSATKIEGFSKNTIASNYLDFLHATHLTSFDAAVFSSLSHLYKTDTTDKYTLTKIYFSQLALKLEQMEGSPLQNTELALDFMENDNITISIISDNLITNHVIEKLIADIRKFFLLSILKENYKKPYTALLTAINKQCKLNGYIYPTDDNELSKVEQLNRKTPKLPHCIREDAQLIANSYSENAITENTHKHPPSTYKNSTLNTPQSDKQELIRSFYEANPYPTWTSKPRNTPSSLDELFTSLNINNPPKDNNILVAGCGTGRHAIQLALTYPHANIKALDISATSLEYAAKKRDEYNIKNLEFIHGDLNHLYSLGIKFSLIECIGVLHHLQNPLKGGQAILSALNERGIAKLGLYSTSARIPIAELKSLATSKKITYEQNNLKIIRKLAIANYNYGRISEIVNSPDFFSRNGCMDLLFHPLEKTFSATDIHAFIKKLKCHFAGFEKGGSEGSPSFIKFDNDTDLEVFFNDWKSFENLNPTFFCEMYLFWLKPIRRTEQ